MHHLARSLFLVVCGTLAVCSADAQEAVGHSDNTVLLDHGGRECAGPWVFNADGTIENAVRWQNEGIVPPDWGAFAEGYNVGPAFLNCVRLYLAQTGEYVDATMDVYVWSVGIGWPGPDEVLAVVPGVSGMDIAQWPDASPTDVEIGIAVDGPFLVGAWANWPGEEGEWYFCVDEDGPRGDPWTNVAPGLGYATGWQHPEAVWMPLHSMCFGVSFGDPAGVEELPEDAQPEDSPTWGQIKSLFGE